MQLELFFVFFQIDDCEDDYNSFVSIPVSTNVSVDTVRSFFNAYLLHKYFVDYIVNLNTTKLVSKNWVYQTNSTQLYEKLMQLQDALNYNIQKLDLLVRNLQPVARYINDYFSLQLNTTCNACISNCSQVTTLNITLINTMEKCISPVYHVISAIAIHSERLLKTIKDLQNVVNNSENGGDDTVTNNVVQDVKDMCFCNAPPPKRTI